MIIALLVILIIVLVWCAYIIYQARQDVLELEKDKAVNEELILNYRRLLKEVKGRCEMGLNSTLIVTSRHCLKEIKASIDNLE